MSEIPVRQTKLQSGPRSTVDHSGNMLTLHKSFTTVHVRTVNSCILALRRIPIRYRSYTAAGKTGEPPLSGRHISMLLYILRKTRFHTDVSTS